MNADVFYEDFKNALKHLDVPWGTMELVEVTAKDGNLYFTRDNRTVVLHLPKPSFLVP